MGRLLEMHSGGVAMSVVAFLATWLALGVFVGWGTGSAARLGGPENEE